MPRNLPEITWEPRRILLSMLKENPRNPKIVNETGRKRLHKSLMKFGLAGTIVVNHDLMIIDGHSRKKDLEATDVTEVWVSVPSRPLTDEEYAEFNAIYDISKAGDTDMVMVEEILTEDLVDEWEIEKKAKEAKGEKEDDEVEKTHVIISFPPEKLPEVTNLLQQLADLEFLEYEQVTSTKRPTVAGSRGKK